MPFYVRVNAIEAYQYYGPTWQKAPDKFRNAVCLMFHEGMTGPHVHGVIGAYEKVSKSGTAPIAVNDWLAILSEDGWTIVRDEYFTANFVEKKW